MDVLRIVQITALSAGALWAAVQIYNWIDGKRKRLHALISFSDLRWSPRLVKAFSFLRTLRYESVLVRLTPFEETTPESRATVAKLAERLAVQTAAAYPERPLLDADNFISVTLTNTGHTTLKSIRVAVSHAVDSWTVTADKQIVESDIPSIAVLPSLPPKAVAQIYFLTYAKMWPRQQSEISITHETGVAKRTVIDPVPKYPFLVSPNFYGLRIALSMAVGGLLAGWVLALLAVWLKRLL